MKKRLLLSLALVCTAMSSWAYNVGDYIFTPSARLKVVSENAVANGSFTNNTTSWMGSDGTSAVNAEYWAVEEGAGPNGENVLQSLNGGAELDNYIYQVVPLSAGSTYVVSFQAKGAANSGTATAVGNANYVDAYVNGDGSVNKSAAGFRQIFTASDNVITTSWSAISDTIQANEDCFLVIGVGRLDAGTQVTDFTVQQVQPVYDTRIAQARIDYDKALLARPEFTVRDETFVEMVGALDEALKTGDGEVVGVDFDDASSTEDFMNSFAELETQFLDANSYDLVSGGIITGPGLWKNKLQKGSGTYGDWYITGGRWMHTSGAADIHDDLPGSYSMDAQKVEIQKALPAGKYLFQIDAMGYTNTGTKNTETNSWYNIDYNTPVTNQLYIGADTLAADTLSPRNYKTYFIIADVAAGEAAATKNLIAGCLHSGHVHGGMFYYKNPVLRLISPTAKDDVNKFDQDNKKAVQLEAAKVMIDSANVVLPKTEYPWGKTALKAAIDKQTALYNALDAAASTEILQVLDADGNPVVDENGNASTKTVADSLTQVMRDVRTAIQACYTENMALTNLVAATADAQSKYDDPANAGATATYRNTLKSLIDQANATINTFYAQTDSLPGDLDNSNAQIAALAEAVENMTSTAASLANPSEVTLTNAAFGSTSGWDLVKDGDSKNAWKTGTKSGFDVASKVIYADRGNQLVAPKNKVSQKVTIEHAGAYEFHCQAFAFNTGSSQDGDVATDFHVNLFIKDVASADTIEVIPLHTLRVYNDTLGYGQETPEYFGIVFNKADEAPLELELGLDGLQNPDTYDWTNKVNLGHGASCYAFGSVHLSYYGDYAQFGTDVLDSLKATMTATSDLLEAYPAKQNDSTLYINSEKALRNALVAAQSAIDGVTPAFPVSAADKAPFMMSYVGWVAPSEEVTAKPRVQTNNDNAKKSALYAKAWRQLKRAQAAFQPLATGIQGVKVNDSVAPSLQGVYNVAGQRVASTADTLAPGLYIINGKKVVVK